MAGLLFIHRLTQEEFRNFMGADRQRQAFSVASTLLCEAFPKLILGQSMRLHWKQCKMYIQHVLILCARWRDSKFMPDDNDDFAAFLLLSTACGWYALVRPHRRSARSLTPPQVSHGIRRLARGD